MGSNGIVVIKSDNNYYGIANTFSSEPYFLGHKLKKIIDHINKNHQWQTFKSNLNKIQFKEFRYEPMPFITFTIFKSGKMQLQKWDKDTIKGQRDLENGIFIEEILKGKISKCLNEIEFIRNSTWCEYGYIINLDELLFEIYKGNQYYPYPNNPFGEDRYRVPIRPLADRRG